MIHALVSSFLLAFANSDLFVPVAVIPTDEKSVRFCLSSCRHRMSGSSFSASLIDLLRSVVRATLIVTTLRAVIDVMLSVCVCAFATRTGVSLRGLHWPLYFRTFWKYLRFDLGIKVWVVWFILRKVMSFYWASLRSTLCGLLSVNCIWHFRFPPPEACLRFKQLSGGQFSVIDLPFLSPRRGYCETKIGEAFC